MNIIFLLKQSVNQYFLRTALIMKDSLLYQQKYYLSVLHLTAFSFLLIPVREMRQDKFYINSISGQP